MLISFPGRYEPAKRRSPSSNARGSGFAGPPGGAPRGQERSDWGALSLRFDFAFLHDLRPLRDLVATERGELLRRVGGLHDTQAVELGLHIGQREDLGDLDVQ